MGTVCGLQDRNKCLFDENKRDNQGQRLIYEAITKKMPTMHSLCKEGINW